MDPDLSIGDVVIADRWGQYMEMAFAREVEDGWMTMPFFEYPHGNFGMMFPRSVTVLRPGAEVPETRFWFPVDEALFASAGSAANDVTLARCTAEDKCLEGVPKIVVGGSGVSGSAFIDNAAFRTWAFETFGARVLDMESAAVAHVAYANDVPFLAVRSLADLAGGGGRGEPDGGFLGPRSGQRSDGGQGTAKAMQARIDRAGACAAPSPAQVMNGMSTMTPRVTTASPIAATAP